jgi:hypothetical protein
MDKVHCSLAADQLLSDFKCISDFCICFPWYFAVPDAILRTKTTSVTVGLHLAGRYFSQTRSGVTCDYAGNPGIVGHQKVIGRYLELKKSAYHLWFML